MPTAIFISHSEQNKDIASKLVELLVSTELGGTGTIFCSSAEGFDIPNGRDLKGYIKDRLDDAPIVIAILTPQYSESKFCLCELGAAWGMAKRLFVLAVPPHSYKDAQAILAGVRIDAVDKLAALNDIYDEIVSMTGRGSKINRWNKAAQAFINSLATLKEAEQKRTSPATRRMIQRAATTMPPASGTTKTITLGELVAQGLGNGVSAVIKHHVDLAAEAKKQTKPVRSEVVPNDIAVANFNGLTATARQRLSTLPNVVQAIVFRTWTLGSCSIVGLHAYELETATSAGFVLPSSGTNVSLNMTNAKIIEVMDTITSLNEAATVLSDEHRQSIRKANPKASFEMMERRFWEVHFGLPYP